MQMAPLRDRNLLSLSSTYKVIIQRSQKAEKALFQATD